MICPKCNAEYREGFTICADCRVELIEKPEDEEQTEEFEIDEDIKFVSILSTYNLSDIAVIKSILGETNIRFFIQGENFNQIRGAIEPAVLKVREEDAQTVRELLKDFEIKFTIYSK